MSTTIINSKDLNLEGVPRTMFLTMLARARETQRENALVHDRMAVEMQKKIELFVSNVLT